MSDSVIEVDNVGKRYRLGEHSGSGSDLRETMARVARRLKRRTPKVRDELWSLRDVSFTVERGEALGIIGRNGAGKSTLLKVVSNITTPTTGQCRTLGRVGSLLEVGTGFHPELTGRENMYLNGAILGMSRREVTNRTEEIVEFAGLAPFMDTPVKRYSSGMYLRLGFSVAAHMQADILVVDEVLAVGDAEFQRKCLGKMSEVEHTGRTVLFVSHNMDAMRRLCPRAIWLENGTVRDDGPTDAVVGRYLASSSAAPSNVSFDTDHALRAQIIGVSMADAVSLTFASDATMSIAIDVRVDESIAGLDVGFMLRNSVGAVLLEEYMSDAPCPSVASPGLHRATATLPPLLPPGEYTIDVMLGTHYEMLDSRDSVLSFTVDGDDLGRTQRMFKVGLQWAMVPVHDLGAADV